MIVFNQKKVTIRILIIVFLFIHGFVSCQIGDTTIAGNFNIFAISSKFLNLQKKLPQLLCSGIFNKTGFTYISGDTLKNIDTLQGYLNQNTNKFNLSVREKLITKKIFYYLSGSYSETNDNFHLEFELADTRSGKIILKYSSNDKPLAVLYEEIDKAALLLKQKIILSRTVIQKHLKNIVVTNYINSIDENVIKNYELKISKDFPAYYISINLSGSNKSNVIYNENAALTSKFNIEKLFDTLNADIIIGGTLANDKNKKSCILQSKLFIKRSDNNGSLIIDTLSMPELRSGYYFLNDLPKKATDDLQTFLNSAITDTSTWTLPILTAPQLNETQLLSKSLEAEKKGDYNLASLYASYASQKKGGSWSGFMQMGHIERSKKNYEASITYYERALEINPQSTQANYYKGLSLFNTGSYTLAITEFNKCLHEEAKYSNLHYWIAYCYFYLNDNKIFEESKIALKFSSDSGYVFELLGRYYIKKETPVIDSAIRYYQWALKSCKNNTSTCQPWKISLSKLNYLKGYTLSDSGMFKKSLYYYSSALVLDSTNNYAINQLRYSYTKLYLPDSVDFFIRLGFKKNVWDTTNIYISQAEDYRYVKDLTGSYNPFALKEALKYINFYESKYGETSLSNRLKGSTFFRLNMWDQAIICYKQALRKSPDKIINYLNLAEVQIMNGESADALNTFMLWRDYEKSSKTALDEEVVVLLFLETTAKIISDEKPTNEITKMEEILKVYNADKKEKVFILNWSFTTFQKWLGKSQFDPDKKKNISRQLINLTPYTLPSLISAAVI